MKFFLYKLLGKKLVPITDYKDSIINLMLNHPSGYTMDLWGFIKREFNAEQAYNWKEQRNYLKFDSTQDLMMFLLKI
jgi:hypothetical protein